MTTYCTPYDRGDKPLGMRYHLDDICRLFTLHRFGLPLFSCDSEESLSDDDDGLCFSSVLNEDR